MKRADILRQLKKGDQERLSTRLCHCTIQPYKVREKQ